MAQTLHLQCCVRCHVQGGGIVADLFDFEHFCRPVDPVPVDSGSNRGDGNMTHEVTEAEQDHLILLTELALLERRIVRIKQQLEYDQSDIETAFAADRLPNTRGFEQT